MARRTTVGSELDTAPSSERGRTGGIPGTQPDALPGWLHREPGCRRQPGDPVRHEAIGKREQHDSRRGDPAPPSLGTPGFKDKRRGPRTLPESGLPSNTAVYTAQVRVRDCGRGFSRRSPALPDWPRPTVPRSPRAARRQKNFIETRGGRQGQGRGWGRDLRLSCHSRPARGHHSGRSTWVETALLRESDSTITCADFLAFIERRPSGRH